MTSVSNDIVDSWFFTFAEIEDVTVVRVDLTPHEEREVFSYSWLDQQERHRWQRFRFDRPRREFALCRAALRAGICSRLGCNNEQLTFGTSRYGKPFGLVDGLAAPIRFNISHSGKYGLIAYTQTGRIGVDVEERSTLVDMDGLSKVVFGANEQADFALTSGEEKLHMFFTLWTFKEAMIKALGLGFSQDPAKFQIPADLRDGASGSIFQFPKMPNDKWKLESLSNSEFAAALVYELNPTSEAD